MKKKIARIIDASEALVNRLHNESVFNPNITECNELYSALFAIGRCAENASNKPLKSDTKIRCNLCHGTGIEPDVFDVEEYYAEYGQQYDDTDIDKD